MSESTIKTSLAEVERRVRRVERTIRRHRRQARVDRFRLELRWKLRDLGWR